MFGFLGTLTTREEKLIVRALGSKFRRNKRGDTMAIVIDVNALNDLLENQKKLDDVFDSMFDEDPFLDSSPALSINSNSDTYSRENEDFSWANNEKPTDQERQSIVYVVMPIVLEIAVLYYGIMYFN